MFHHKNFKKYFLFFCNILLMSVLLLSCSGTKKLTHQDKQLLEESQKLFAPIPVTLVDRNLEAPKIALGKKLYLETKLSRSGTISCNSCHRLDNFGVDNMPTSPGHNGLFGGRNSPSTFNAALHFVQFWDGRAKDLAEQALGPLTNPIEHGLKNHDEVLKILKNAGYEQEFRFAFPESQKPLVIENVAKAIATFEKTLMTPSAFDSYLHGDVHALSENERKGLKKFIEVGCTQCHSGPLLGGNSFQKLGVVKPYPTKDLGVFEVTKKSRDKFKFKTPSLRNIVKTGPYFHDGSIQTLEESIKIMGEYQLGKDLSAADINEIIVFLNSLTAVPQTLTN
jgi:cytochrome c peroxidase